MNFKTTYILFGLLGLMLAILGIVLYSGPSAPAGEGFVFPSMHARDKELKPEQVDRVVVERKKSGEPDLVFERVDPITWKIASPAHTPADSRLVPGLIDQILSAKPEKEGTAPRPSKAGLDEPSRIITLHAGDRLWTLKVGDVTPGTENALVYVMSSDLPGKTLAVPKSSLEAALEGYEYYRAKELLGENSADITAVKITQGKKLVELKKEKERWVMTRPAYGDVDAAELLTQLTNLRVEHKDAKSSDFVENGVTDFAKYPQLAPAADPVRIDVTHGAEGKPATTRSALVGTSKKANDKSYYAAFDADAKAKDVVRVAADSVAPIIKWVEDPGAFRSKNLLALESFHKPDAILIKNEHGELEFFRTDEKDSWQLYRGASAHNVDPTEVRKLIDGLNKKGVVVSFPDPKRRNLVEKPHATVRVYSDSLEKPDAKKPGKPVLKKDAKPAAELRFGLPEGNDVAVDRIWGADATLVMVPKSLDAQVREGPLAYFDRTIPSFNPGSAEENVTKVELTRGGQTFVVTRSASTGPWKIEQPAALKGRNADAQAVRGILGDLNRLTAREIVTEKADAKTLETHNLAKPPVRVVVTLTKDGKPVTTTFDFGNEAGARGVYLKISGRDAVYLVGNEALEPLKRELRDTAVFAFDPSKVTTITITGWSAQQGAAESLTFDQKDGTWAAKVPPTYRVDPAKVAAFVEGLSRLRLERFVPTGKGLKLEEDALEVKVTLADKTELELMVGAPDGAGYFATSKQHPGDTFVVGKGLFEEARKRKGYFAK